MIVDKIENKDLYCSISRKFDTAFEYIINTNLSALDAGKHEIDGNNIFIIVNEYKTQDNELNILEAHKKYIDIQYLEKGSEIIEYEALNYQKVYKEYDTENDYALYYSNTKSKLELDEGMFAIFFPNDLHMPGIKNKTSNNVRKIVVKILID